jgi:hypothetical protein
MRLDEKMNLEKLTSALPISDGFGRLAAGRAESVDSRSTRANPTKRGFVGESGHDDVSGR